MSDESKSPSPPSPGDEQKPAGDPIAAAKPAASVAAQTPAATGVPPKPAAPTKPAGPVPVPWDSPLVTKFKRQYGSGVSEASTYLGQNYLIVDASIITEVLTILRDQEQFDFCVDITAAHYPKREKQFDVLWILYSFERNERMRVKIQIADGETVPSSFSLWPTADWLEREMYDMFGIRFEGHPNLKRILLPDGWKGFPLRKDYSIIQQDQEWVKINLGIESGQ